MPDLKLDELSMVGITLDKWKLVAKSRGIKGMSEERLLSALSRPKLMTNNFNIERLKKTREDLNNQDKNFRNQK